MEDPDVEVNGDSVILGSKHNVNAVIYAVIFNVADIPVVEKLLAALRELECQWCKGRKAPDLGPCPECGATTTDEKQA